MSMCPYKRPYNSGTIRVRLLPLPTVITALTCGNRPVGYSPAPSFPPSFRFPKPCAKVRILPGAPIKVRSTVTGCWSIVWDESTWAEPEVEALRQAVIDRIAVEAERGAPLPLLTTGGPFHGEGQHQATGS